VKYLKELSNMFWARPENALWVTKVMQEMDSVEFEGPILDLMCGHGMWSFIRAGGDFGYNWDSYKVLQSLGNYQDGVDIQNTFSDEYKPEITRRPNYRISCGFDWKENNLKKCEALDFYDRLVQGDCNEPLPFEDNEFKTIFSNTVYWVDDIDHILKELTRIVHPEGKVVLLNYLPNINQYLDIYSNRASDEWLKLIDRNRSVENKHIFEKAEWIRRLDEAGLELKEYIPTVNQLYAHIWNIGLRPFSGYILDMAQNLTPEQYAEMKQGWVDTLTTVAEPFLSDPLFAETVDGQEAEAIFVLTKK
jgi:SAM-dependent methyltransferase